MKIYKNIPLKSFNSFRLEYQADYLVSISTDKEAIDLFNESELLRPPILILGGGSNILFTEDYKGTILYPEFKGVKIEENDAGSGTLLVSAGAGVNWDDFVAWTVNKRFGGLENLSLIPGKVGATPVQNIGAYGVEIKDLIEKVRTINITNGSIRVFSNKECEFDYRNSIFKKSEKGKYLITRVYFRLATEPFLNLAYESLKQEVGKLGPETLKNVRQGVINIRQRKLPDPEIIGNAGSFFKNPVVESTLARNLKSKYPELPVYEDKDGFMKLASGWLIEMCGWKGKRIGDAGVHDKQALVLINHGKATGMEIYSLSEEIKKSVLSKFGINLEREVEVIGVT